MKNIESQYRIIHRQAKDLYEFIADFHNFEKFLPEQVTDWNATETTCSFNIPNQGKIALQMEKNDAAQSVKYVSTSGPAVFELLFELKPETETSCQLTLTALADIPAFMLMMISKPIKNFVTVLLDKIKELAEA
jgi:ribosome-associated toxin RatA of RatAB toxin-antitoxin module